MAEVIVLLEGYSKEQSDGSVLADCTISLIRSGHDNIVVDTGNVGDEEKITAALKKAGLIVDAINYVIHSHGHPDHVACSYLFKNATIIGFGTINKGEVFNFFDDTYKLTEEVEVKKTPGHTSLDVTVFVNASEGVIAVAGDLFDNENDNLTTNLAKPWSYNWLQQKESQRHVWEKADFIVPGHGKMFSTKI